MEKRASSVARGCTLLDAEVMLLAWPSTLTGGPSGQALFHRFPRGWPAVLPHAGLSVAGLSS